MADGGPRHIFCVNGSADFLTLLREFFLLEGFQVTTAIEAEDSFDLITAARSDLIVIDLSPRRDDALELLTRLRFWIGSRRLPLIVLSTSSELIQQAQAQTGGDAPVAFLRKPVDLDHLLATVRALLGLDRDVGQHCS